MRYFIHKKVNALGEKILYAYDLAGRKTGIWKQMGEDSYQATVYRYDAAGNVVKKGVEVRQSVHWKNHPGPSPSERLMIRRTVLSESRTEPAQKYVTPMTS